MTKKDFFNVIIKVFGLYWLINLIGYFGQFASVIGYGSYDLISIMYGVLSLFIAVLLIVLLIFKSHIIVRFLKLDKGFEGERIDLNFSFDKMIQFALLLIGGFLILDNIAPLLNQCFLFFRKLLGGGDQFMGQQFQNSYYLIVAVGKLLVGYLFLVKNLKISRFLYNLVEKGA